MRDEFLKILKEYKTARSQPLKKHPLAELITRTIPEHLLDLLEKPRLLKIEGSVGKGNWATCPWIAVFNTTITDTAQFGYYPVYLFREDMQGVYLSINQGVTDIRERYKEDPKEVLRIRAQDFRAQIGPTPGSSPRRLFTWQPLPPTSPPFTKLEIFLQKFTNLKACLLIQS